MGRSPRSRLSTPLVRGETELRREHQTLVLLAGAREGDCCNQRTVSGV